MPLIALALLFSACGYVGDPMPPALNIPTPVTDLAVVERGDKLVVTYTVPAMTTENLPLRRVGASDIQVGDKHIAGVEEKPGRTTQSIPAGQFAGQKVAIKVRINNGRDRYSQWSNEVTLNVIPPLAMPADVEAKPATGGMRITWKGDALPGETWQVFKAGTETPATVNRPEYLDPAIEDGKEYTYSVRALLNGAESDVSTPVTVTAKDVTPPAVPAGLTVVIGTNTVELNWDPNTEPDFKCYRVYRSVNGAAMQVIADNLQTPAYSDKSVKSNENYRYTVTAVDQVGNESGQSTPVEARLR